MNDQHTKYYCPMKCEGDKEYDSPGDCPVCNMHLVPVNGSKAEHAHSHVSTKRHKHTHSGTTVRDTKHQYICPMGCEGNKGYDEPGRCPVCGMNLKKVGPDYSKQSTTHEKSCCDHDEENSKEHQHDHKTHNHHAAHVHSGHQHKHTNHDHPHNHGNQDNH